MCSLASWLVKCCSLQLLEFVAVASDGSSHNALYQLFPWGPAYESYTHNSISQEGDTHNSISQEGDGHTDTHLISMSRSWANSQCFLFSTSMKPHFVCLPRTFFPPTATSRSLPITANGICCYKKRKSVGVWGGVGGCVWGECGCVWVIVPLFWS